jgi:hypothetical protein
MGTETLSRVNLQWTVTVIDTPTIQITPGADGGYVLQAGEQTIQAADLDQLLDLLQEMLGGEESAEDSWEAEAADRGDDGYRRPEAGPMRAL